MFRKTPVFDYIYPILYHGILIGVVVFLSYYVAKENTVPILTAVLTAISYICFLISMFFKNLCLIIETKSEYGFEKRMRKAYNMFDKLRTVTLISVCVAMIFCLNGI